MLLASGFVFKLRFSGSYKQAVLILWGVVWGVVGLVGGGGFSSPSILSHTLGVACRTGANYVGTGLGSVQRHRKRLPTRFLPF